MVYVDTMSAPYRGMRMCHMAADSRAELLQMADTIGVQRRWIQCKGTWKEHFDICLSKRKLALQNGARELTQIEFVKILIARRNERS